MPKGSLDNPLSFVSRHPAPWLVTTSEDLGGMKLNTVGVGRIDCGCQLVEFLGKPMGLGLEDGDSTEEKVVLGHIGCRTRVV